jgi:N utilization substance protein B
MRDVNATSLFLKSLKENMMKRRELREHIFEILFRVEFMNETEMEEQMELFFEDLAEARPADVEYIKNKYMAVREKMPMIDIMIDEKSKGWKTSRMGKVELTILRLAVYEMLFDEDVPMTVAINEAVEIAKKFGGDDTPSFVNGILAKVTTI